MTRSELHLNDPQQLYRGWEDSQWSPFAIDLSRDAEQWQAAQDSAVRALVLYALSSLMFYDLRRVTEDLG